MMKAHPAHITPRSPALNAPVKLMKPVRQRHERMKNRGLLGSGGLGGVSPAWARIYGVKVPCM